MAISEEKPLTIGAVCKELKAEFDDVSISKIRYLEEQQLLHPLRTQGGYRLYRREDIETVLNTNLVGAIRVARRASRAARRAAPAA